MRRRSMFAGLAAASGLWRNRLLAAQDRSAVPPQTGDHPAQTLFQSGEAGYFCFRIPALAVTKSGAILAFVEARKESLEDYGDIDLAYKRSLDNGKTWEPVKVLFNDGKRAVNQPAPVLDRHTGNLWLVFCKDNKQAFVTHTADDGDTWAAPREITSTAAEPTWKYVASGPGHGIQLKSGRLLIPCWGDTTPGELAWRPKWGEVTFSFAMYSDDHGETWKHGRPMYENLTNECQAAELSDGRVYMTLRTRRGTVTRRAYAWSEDEGYSWSRIEIHKDLPDPHCQGSILALPPLEGKDRLLFTNPNSELEPVRDKLTVRMSEDGGRTWPHSRVLYKGLAAYSDLMIAPDGKILCFYEADDYEKIVLARFDLQWLTSPSAFE
ncbi:MAG: glycoside hydrolase [Bryobacteraceae bacterium]|nr:glycoside hydrolase [Bryobacteraceae bacterium]